MGFGELLERLSRASGRSGSPERLATCRLKGRGASGEDFERSTRCRRSCTLGAIGSFEIGKCLGRKKAYGGRRPKIKLPAYTDYFWVREVYRPA